MSVPSSSTRSAVRAIAVLVLIVSVVWLVTQPGFEPLIMFLTSLAAFLGSFLVGDQERVSTPGKSGKPSGRQLRRGKQDEELEVATEMTATQERSAKILIVDDEETTVQLLAILLELKGFEVVKTYRAEDGLRMAYRTHPDLVLLDVMMPDMDGWEVCRRLRELSGVPIIFLTAKRDIQDVVRGLEMGADDYIVKPYDNDELVARVKAHLRRTPATSATDEAVCGDGEFIINFLKQEVVVRGENIFLTPKEYSLLSVLARNAGRVVTRHELVTEAWGPEYADAIDSLKLYVHYLRRKIEKDHTRPEYLLTARGVGYRFVNK